MSKYRVVRAQRSTLELVVRVGLVTINNRQLEIFNEDNGDVFDNFTYWVSGHITGLRACPVPGPDSIPRPARRSTEPPIGVSALRVTIPRAGIVTER
jgi:hypothetical protein